MTATPTSSTIRRTMPDILAAVLKELKRREWSRYDLVQSLRGKRPGKKDVPQQTVYRFLRGESDINSTDLGHIFDVFGWKLPPKK